MVEAEGPRARKRRETLQRITETALRLFLADGYEATTLDAIALAAGISRRTFFYYFRSKEEILLAWQSGIADVFNEALRPVSAEQEPIDVVRTMFVNMVSRFDPDEFRKLDGLMRATEAVRARKQANYELQEQVLFAALCRIWPQAKRRQQLRLVAMASVGAFRLALDQWGADGGARPIAEYVDENFAILKNAF